MSHQKRAHEKPEELYEAIGKEIMEGWLSNSTRFPRTVPFRACPRSIELKKEANSWLLICNHSAPMRGSWASTLEGKNWKQTAVATNESTDLSEQIMFEWASIHRNSEMVWILVEGGRETGFRVFGRAFDVRK